MKDQFLTLDGKCILTLLLNNQPVFTVNKSAFTIFRVDPDKLFSLHFERSLYSRKGKKSIHYRLGMKDRYGRSHWDHFFSTQEAATSYLEETKSAIRITLENL